MRGIAWWIVVFWLLAPSISAFGAQTDDPPAADQESAQVGQLRNIREGITDVEARQADRRRWASVLLSYDIPQAKALAAELLKLSDRPEVQQTLCSVIAEQARENPSKVDPSFVDPLIELLDAEVSELRTLAAEALADIPGTDVPTRLGELASQADVPLTKRLAAIDALAPNTHRREVVAQLIALLDSSEPAVVERVTGALSSATPQSHGLDTQRWHRWWDEKSQLDEESWLAEQLRTYRDRSRRVSDELRVFRETVRDGQATLKARTSSFQRELFRTLPADQRPAKLVEWLEDPIPIVKLTALGIIRARIADEGQRPEGAVLTSLLEQLRQGSPSVRREVVEIIQNLNDPVIVEALLARLPREDDPGIRLTIFKALGKLGNPDAIPALVAAVASPQSPSECVREAAVALGAVAAQSTAGENIESAVAALKSRYQSSDREDAAMRAALLTAMAGVASDAFAPEFMDAVESDDAAVLGPAIRGVLAADGRSKLPRLRTLMAHADPRVRLAAIDAVGRLGREEADLESLLTRLNPSIEVNELAREAAWRGFRHVMANHSVEDRIQAAGRLRDLPDLQIRYLEDLADAFSGANGSTSHLEDVLDRLAAALVAGGRYEEAVTYLETLFDMQSERSDAGTFGCGLRLLNAMLRSPTEPEVAVLITQLSALSPDDAAGTRILETVGAYLETLDAATDPGRLRRLLAELNTVPTDALGDAWTLRLTQAAERLSPPEPEPGQDTDPPSPTSPQEH